MEVTIQKITERDKKVIPQIADLHKSAFKGFFLTFMGKGFLKLMYKCYCKHESSNILVAYENGGGCL